jgi:hypothetical protein
VLKEKLAAPPLIDVVEYGRLTPPPREQQGESQQQQSQPAPTAGGGDVASTNDNNASSAAAAEIDLDLAALRAAAAAGDEPTFKTQFWRAMRALDRAGRAAERDVRALLPGWSDCCGGGDDGNREAQRPSIVKDLISVRDEPPEEWRWSPKSSVDLGTPGKAREAVVATEVKRGSGIAQKENEAPRETVASPDDVLELFVEKGESVTPSAMLTAIEKRLKSVGLHKNCPERAYIYGRW